jgi:hypothetical protein
MEKMHSDGRQSDVFSLQFSTVYVNDGKQESVYQEKILSEHLYRSHNR